MSCPKKKRSCHRLNSLVRQWISSFASWSLVLDITGNKINLTTEQGRVGTVHFAIDLWL